MKVIRYHGKLTKAGLNSIWVRAGIDPTTLPAQVLERFGNHFAGQTPFDLDTPRTSKNPATPLIRAGIEREGFYLVLGASSEAN